MHFSKVISATLFAVLATAAPVSYDLARLQSVMQGFEEFKGRTEGEASKLKEQLDQFAASSSGDVASAVQDLSKQLDEATTNLKESLGTVSDRLVEIGQSYDPTESQAANSLNKLASTLGGDEASKESVGSDDEAAKATAETGGSVKEAGAASNMLGSDDEAAKATSETGDSVKEAGSASNSLGAGGPSQ
ncbi:hypothetical protein ASPSYDRAFT_51023 [Aspergillus sydowii CBS 593.65]|uniref:Uncharacterized protein n=1 Tax=Aspergillus sydowii CBS 593.65 TaxID=1036612 RepID=A0A1L9T234_9EURO|nr:uncharacterized protein ASPSYDRAFT_51023 [Aspergillus sydowii CBS 593.65]OJJ53524.1 hypothetical protein ASPSYDRAFT_51023 [Aspergillus sydowii CBS 593.65]